MRTPIGILFSKDAESSRKRHNAVEIRRKETAAAICPAVKKFFKKMLDKVGQPCYNAYVLGNVVAFLSRCI